jgi:hypothetical protein
METVGNVGKKVELMGRNLLGWTRPLAARVWITVLAFFR